MLAECPCLFFCEMCGWVGNDMLRKRKIVNEKVGSLGQENDGDAHS